MSWMWEDQVNPRAKVVFIFGKYSFFSAVATSLADNFLSRTY